MRGGVNRLGSVKDKGLSLVPRAQSFAYILSHILGVSIYLYGLIGVYADSCPWCHCGAMYLIHRAVGC